MDAGDRLPSVPDYEPDTDEDDSDFAGRDEHDDRGPLLPVPAFDEAEGLPPAFNPHRADIRRGDGCLRGWLAAPQILSTLFTAGVLVSLVFTLQCGVTFCEHQAPWPLIFLIFVVAYFVEAFMSTELKYLRNVQSNESVRRLIEGMHRAEPRITWHVKCYHFEERVTYTTDSDGKQKEERHDERIDTYSASAEYRFYDWRDVSGEMRDFGRNALTKIQFHKTFDFENRETRDDYMQRLHEFRRVNNRDTHQDFSMEFSLPGFVDYVLQDLEPHDRPTHLNERTFWMATCCFMTVPFRIWLGAICGRTSHTFVKRISIQ